jgi:hypothetical protein
MFITNLSDRIIRTIAACLLLALFLFLIWTTARAGLSSLFSTYAARANQLAAADAAVRVAPGDPEAHYLRAAILEAGDLPAAISEYENATRLRPDDYVLWLALARACELNGDMDHALAAARQAVPLAPYYAQPHWQLGNLLVRAGLRDEGFTELRLAGASDGTLLPGIIDLAWQLSGGDVQLVKQAVQPQSPDSYKALAQYFKKHHKTAEAIEMFCGAGSAADSERRQFLSELIEARAFKDAFALWSRAPGADSRAATGAIVDPGFEQESNLDEPGFGWRAENKAQTILLSLDSGNPREGKSSLAIEFKGDSDPSPPVISQLVLVEPNAHYELHFSARAENVVTGGPPKIIVLDAGDNGALSQPVQLPRTTVGWQDFRIDFNCGGNTGAIRIALQRERCEKSPCPIFGRLWLDAFALRKL